MEEEMESMKVNQVRDLLIFRLATKQLGTNGFSKSKGRPMDPLKDIKLVLW